MNRHGLVAVLLLACGSSPGVAHAGKSPLALVKTDDPRDTMRTFMTAMNDYKRAVETEDEAGRLRLADAVRTLDLSEVSLLPQQTGEDAAIYLKEVIDRVIHVKYQYIPTLDPDEPDAVAGKAFLESHNFRWRLKDTEITIHRMASGPRMGEYLFTSDTVLRAKEWFERVRHLPYLDSIPAAQRGSGYQKPLIEQMSPKWMTDTFLTLALWQWIGLFMAILVGLVIKAVLRHLTGLVGKVAARSESQWDDLVVKAAAAPTGFLGTIGLWFLALHLLRFEGSALSIFTVVLKVFFSGVLIWLVYRLAGVLTDYLKALADKTESTLDDHLVPLVNRTLKILIVVAGVLIAVQNLGFNVVSVLAGLGIGGLAIAMAAKDTVANFFGSLMILFDRPFQVGDWIVLSSAEGTVEEIGFRSTRLRTFYNSVVSVPNMEVANAEIDNMGLRQYRRVLAKLGVTYDTPPEKLEAFMEGIKNIIKANNYTRKDYFHVVFSEYGDCALVVMIYFFLKVPTWNDELVERQNIYLEILRLAQTLEVEFAFPTQTLHVETFPEKQPVRGPHRVEADWLKQSARAFAADGEQAKPKGQGFFVPPHRE